MAHLVDIHSRQRFCQMMMSDLKADPSRLTQVELSVIEANTDVPSEYNFAYQRYVYSSYLASMHWKRYREVREAGIEELSELAAEVAKEKIDCSLVVERVRRMLTLVDATESCKEELTITSSVVDVCNSGLAAVERTLKVAEASLNQLPIGDGVYFPTNDQEGLENAVELLVLQLNECINGMGMEKRQWKKYSEIMEILADSDLLLQKERCDNLIKRINEVMLKLSSLRAAKASWECLSE